MDFTGFTMQDHYRAVAEERERQIVRSSWRRKLDEARRNNTASCCAAYARDQRPGEVPSIVRRPIGGVR